MARVRNNFNKIDYFLRDLSRGMSRIQQGQIPDGSGTTIGGDGFFFLLPGRDGGQNAHGGNKAGNNLILSSTTHGDKGFTYIGDPTVVVAVDEDTGRVGVGTSTPSAVLHVSSTSATTNARPNADIGSPSNWKGQDGGTTNLQNYVNETSTDETTYLTETPTTGTGPLDLQLWAAGQVPFSGSPTVVLTARIRRFDNGGAPAGTEQLKMELFRSSTSVTSQNSGFLSTSFQNFSYTLTSSEVSSLYNAGLDNAHVQFSVIGIGVNTTGYDIAQVTLAITTGSAYNLIRWDVNGSQSGMVDVSGKLGIGTGSGSLTAMGQLTCASASTVGAITKAASSQTGNLHEWQDSSGTILSRITSNGTFDGPISGSLTSPVLISDAAFTIFDDATPTKLFKFQLSGISASTTRTWTVGNYSGIPVVPTDEGTSGYIMVSSGAGVQPVWQSLGSTTISVADNLFSIFDNVTPTKIGAFQLDGLTAGTHTYRLPPTTAASTSTLAAIDLAQTFTAAQIITPTSGTPLNLNPLGTSNATGIALQSTFTRTAFTGNAANQGIWYLNPTISNAASGITGTTNLLAINGTVSNIADIGVRGLFMNLTGSQDAALATGTSSMIGLRYSVTTTGTSGVEWSDINSVQGQVTAGGGDTHTQLTGMRLAMTINAPVTSAATGNVLAVHLSEVLGTGSMNRFRAINLATPPGAASGTPGDLFTSGPTCTDAWGIFIGKITRATNNTGIEIDTISGTAGTNIGILMANVSGGATANWSLAIGTSSSAGKSYHWAPFRFGDNTAPTHRIEIAAGTSTIAPVRLTSATLITSPASGCWEYDGSFFYLTPGSTRQAIATDGNVVVDETSGDVVTVDGQILLAA